MKIVSIEPTPSPNNMKLNMDEHLPEGVKLNFTAENAQGAPGYLQKLLNVPGVKSVYQVANFIALERHPKADWQPILAKARDVFEAGERGEISSAQAEGEPAETFGEVHVFIQMFKGIPMQVKLTTATEEKRVPLPDRFLQAAMTVQSTATNVVLERKWEERGVRYGELEDIGHQVAQEVAAAYDDERLQHLVSQALDPNTNAPAPREDFSPEEVLARLDDPDWKTRYAALERFNPTRETLPVLAKAMRDPKMSVRRLAVAYLGMIEDPVVLPYLFEALKDKSATIRRTAGDCLSDLGDPAAIGPMCEALKDANKIVRWRAARYLYEVGDESAIPALREAQDDPEFEVQMQVKIALERIEGGHAAEGTVWQQMTRRIAEDKKEEE